MNKDKGAVAMKACKAACIGCGKCVKECKFEAITLEGNVSYIDPEKCRLCKKCVEACPTKAIHAVNFPAPKPKAEAPATAEAPAAKAETPAAKAETPAAKAEAPATPTPERKEEQA